ncbi:MAG: hypothetical protein AAGF35_05280 [Pseudomonadota bacterium]
MKIYLAIAAFTASLLSPSALALSLSTEEFQASRLLACVLAEESLGYLSEREYGERTHTVLDGFDAAERDAILAKALGYYDGLMFDIPPQQVNARLEDYIASSSCNRSGYERVSDSQTRKL